MTENLWYHKLKTARLERKWTQADLAEALMIDDGGMVSRWERGQNVPEEKHQHRLIALFPDVVFAFPPPHPREQLWDVPYQPNPFFTGREDVLDALRQRLMEGKTTALT